MDVIGTVLGALAALSVVIVVWQFIASELFPLHAKVPAPPPDPAPGVTLLKSLKGCEASTRECLLSWIEQDYPGPVQVLFAAASADDPAVNVARGLIEARRGMDAEMVVCGTAIGLNAKMSNLAQLEGRIRHPRVVISDADVLAPRDLLRQIVPALEDERTGMVNCFYRLDGGRSLAAQWEAAAVNGDFWAQVLQARMLGPQDFALGAVMAMRTDVLARIGGLAGVVDYLADDYQLGNRVAKLGFAVEMLPTVVACKSPPEGWRDAWNHQVRWARTIRFCQPGPYFLSVLGNATLWPVLWFMVSPGIGTGLTAGLILCLRMATGWRQRGRMEGRGVPGGFAVLVLLKDALQVVIWASAYLGRSVLWRGERFEVLSDGRLSKPGVGIESTNRVSDRTSNLSRGGIREDS